MNTENEKAIIKLLEEIRDLLKNQSVSAERTANNPTKGESKLIPSEWDTFFQEKETKNYYFIVALAVCYLTNGNSDQVVEKKALESFLEAEVSLMNGRNINQDIQQTVGTYGYISSAGYGKYKINATTREIVSQLPNEDSLKNLPKKYHKSKRKKHGKKKTEK